MKKSKGLSESEEAAKPEILNLINDWEGRTEICNKLGLTAGRLTKILDELFPMGYIHPQKILFSRLKVDDNAFAARAVGKKVWKQFPSFDFWQRVDLSCFEAVAQLSHPYNIGILEDKWRDFHMEIPITAHEIKSGGSKIGEDYPVKKKRYIILDGDEELS